MPEADFHIKQNDTGSAITSVLRDEDNVAVNIQNATVRFHMRPIGSTIITTVDEAASNDQVADGSDGSLGAVSYAWQAGDTVDAGLYLGEWEVTYAAAAGIQTFPNYSYLLIRITEQVS